MKALMNNFLDNGEVIWIGVRPERRQPLIEIRKAEAIIGQGLSGDRFHGNAQSKRQVTLIQQEHLTTIASFLRKDSIDPGLVRRNVVVKGINLQALRNRQFQIGTAKFEFTGDCHPCSRMEEALGVGGYNAMRGHGGITVRIVESGEFKIGDRLIVIDAD